MTSSSGRREGWAMSRWWIALLAVPPVVSCLSLVGCRESVDPTFAVNGEWQYSFSAISPDSCQTPGLVQGCSGVGILFLTESANGVVGSYSVRSACQSCDGATDVGGTHEFPGPVSLGTTLAFTIEECDFFAEMPTSPADEVVGEVRCRPGEDVLATGVWRMTRVER